MTRPRYLHLLSRAARVAQTVADEGLADLKLSAAQAGALFSLSAETATSVTSMAEAMGLAQSAASVLVQKLEQAGLVERTPDPSDRRAALLMLTARGAAVRARAAERARRMNQAAVRGFSADEQGVIARWLQHMIDMKETDRE
jgi:DNA-binding MarR family transcriptional regulator